MPNFWFFQNLILLAKWLIMGFQVKYLCIKDIFVSYYPGNSLAVQWLGLHASTSRGMGLIPDRGTKNSQFAEIHTPPKILYLVFYYLSFIKQLNWVQFDIYKIVKILHT